MTVHLESIAHLRGRRYIATFGGERQRKTITIEPNETATYYYWNGMGVIRDTKTQRDFTLKVQTPYLVEGEGKRIYALRDSLVFFHQHGPLDNPYCEGYRPLLLPRKYPDMVDYILSQLIHLANQNDRFATVPKPRLVELVKQRLCTGVMMDGTTPRFLVAGDTLLP